METPYCDRTLSSLNRSQKFVLTLATFAFVITALRPPFLFGRRVRYGWLWSHSGTRIELTRLLVEWVLIIVMGTVTVLSLKESRVLAPVLRFRRWWLNRRSTVSRSAASWQASAPSTKHPARRLGRIYVFAIAATVFLLGAVVVGFILHVPNGDGGAGHLSNTAERDRPQLNEPAASADAERAISQEPTPSPISNAAAVDEEQPPRAADPRPRNYNSLPTGTRIEEDVGTNGHGELTVKNGTSEDAVVRLSDAGTYETVRWFFVQAHTSAQVAKIPEGTYRLAFTSGLNWVEPQETFSWHPSYSKFERVLTFGEERDTEGVRYHSISVTLHAVPFGNVKTRSISREEFLEGHRHTTLLRP
jgi:hypothetical protein